MDALIGAVGGLIGAVAGVGALVVALIARADAKESQKDAASAATRATEATEKMAAIQLATFDRPPWRVEWLSGDSYLLTNSSPVDAIDVAVSSDPADLGLQVDRQEPYDVGAMSAIKIMYVGRLSHGWGRDVIVTWKRAGSAENLTWRHPIPPKPKS